MKNADILNRLEKIRAKQPWLVMSAAEKFSLTWSDNPAISHFYSFETTKDAQETIAIPDGCVDIIFDCDLTEPVAEVYGTPMEAVEIELKRQHRYFGVRFASGVVPDCLDISAEELIAHHYSLQDVIPLGNQLVENIAGETDFRIQVQFFQNFFEGKSTRKLSALTQALVNFIFEHNGNIRIDDLANWSGYTTRTLQRQFKADLGMSPKSFARIVRCQCAVYRINHGREFGFSDMAFDLGFSDQPHFLREFKKLVNATPMAYQSRVKEHTYLDRIRYI